MTAVALGACTVTNTGGTGGSTSVTGTGGEAAGVGGAGGSGGAGGAAACDATYTCAEAVDPEKGDPAKLCDGEHGDLYDKLSDCTCTGACATVCGDNSCKGMATSTECKMCIADTAAGCGNEFNNCSNDL